jgi:hypothetical protein
MTVIRNAVQVDRRYSTSEQTINMFIRFGPAYFLAVILSGFIP